MIQPALKQWKVFGHHVMAALIEAAQARQTAQTGLREVTAMDVFLAMGCSARAGFALSCGRLPVAIQDQVCLITPQQWDLYVSEFAEIQGAL